MSSLLQEIHPSILCSLPLQVEASRYIIAVRWMHIAAEQMYSVVAQLYNTAGWSYFAHLSTCILLLFSDYHIILSLSMYHFYCMYINASVWPLSAA